MLFFVSLVDTPTVVEAQAGGQEKLILAEKSVVARDQHTALVITGAAHAKEIPTARGDNLRVVVRVGG